MPLAAGSWTGTMPKKPRMTSNGATDTNSASRRKQSKIKENNKNKKIKKTAVAKQMFRLRVNTIILWLWNPGKLTLLQFMHSGNSRISSLCVLPRVHNTRALNCYGPAQGKILSIHHSEWNHSVVCALDQWDQCGLSYLCKFHANSWDDPVRNDGIPPSRRHAPK